MCVCLFVCLSIQSPSNEWLRGSFHDWLTFIVISPWESRLIVYC